MRIWKKGLLAALAPTLVVGMLTACSGGAKKEPDAAGASVKPSTSAAATATPTPSAPVKLRVELWDRSNAAPGKTITDNFLTNWIAEEVKKIGIDIEFVPVPRAQEEEKLNVWLASGGSPDIIFTYNATIMQRYAEQGGLQELGELIDKYGPNIKEQNKVALGLAGTYKGKRYAVPARVEAIAGSMMKIRQDWLDKVGMKVPTTPDELYAVLKAFKEKDPGGVGKDNVVPWGLAAPSQGMQAFWFGLGFGFGINHDGPGGIIYMPFGNYRDGAFTSGWATPEGKTTFAFMNKAYKEGLIAREFATDVNNQKLNEALAKGWVGFIDSNGSAATTNPVVRKSVPTAKWVNVPPFKRPDGKQVMPVNQKSGMLVMVPKTSKVPEAAIKYLNWMVQPENITTLLRGKEGVHYKVEDGLNIPINPDQRKVDLFTAADVALLYNGSMEYTLAQLKKLNDTPENPDNGDFLYDQQEMSKKYGVTEKTIDQPRPFAEKNNAIFSKYLYEAIAKTIMAPDFEKEYGALVDGWNKLGGQTYDKEVTDALKAMEQTKK
ncbi:MAG: extracellular solute-binding protein [Paenibacillaceae bacterium]|nr:extracellular solute-binding protein [Paenibacillaceae bacterium]